MEKESDNKLANGSPIMIKLGPSLFPIASFILCLLFLFLSPSSDPEPPMGGADPVFALLAILFYLLSASSALIVLTLTTIRILTKTPNLPQKYKRRDLYIQMIISSLIFFIPLGLSFYH